MGTGKRDRAYCVLVCVCAHTDVTASEVIVAIAALSECLVVHHVILGPELVDATVLVFLCTEWFRLSTRQHAVDVL